MTRIYTCNVPIEADVVDAFCWLQKGFTDQFVYDDKQNPTRYMGLGRCIALPSLRDVEYEYGEGSSLHELSLIHICPWRFSRRAASPCRPSSC